jgi:DNA-binding HxlR family transcriptional regulator
VGAKRFGDLEEALRGMGTNLLASRLRQLQAHGVVERVNPPRRVGGPGQGQGYRLTPRGRELEGAVVALARWGIPELGVYRRGEVARPDWLAVVLKARFDRTAARRVDETYEFRVTSAGKEDVLHARVRRGTLSTQVGPAPQPDLTLSMDLTTYTAIAGGQLTLDRAAKEVHVSGDEAAVNRCLAVFGLGGASRSSAR